MRPLSLILFCNQPDLKGDPLESWVFDDLGGTNYLDIILHRWKKIGKFKQDLPADRFKSNGQQASKL